MGSSLAPILGATNLVVGCFADGEAVLLCPVFRGVCSRRTRWCNFCLKVAIGDLRKRNRSSLHAPGYCDLPAGARRRGFWWAHLDSNQDLAGYEPGALPLSYRPTKSSSSSSKDLGLDYTKARVGGQARCTV